MTTLNHLMVDLETMGTRPNAPIVSIGAVFFDPNTGEIGPEFYRGIDIQDSFRYAVADGGTVKWWMKQSDAARASAIEGGATMADALAELAEFYGRGRNAQVWANGPSFDIVILEYAYHRALAQTAPWDFWNARCVRTIVELAKGKVERPKEFTRGGTAHNALDDAIFQAKYVSDMWRAIKGVTGPEATRPVDFSKLTRPDKSEPDDLLGI